MSMNPNLATYRLFVPSQAVGGHLIYFDLFNAVLSDKIVVVSSVNPIVSGALAVTGLVAVDLFLNRTSAIGTGGTAATLNGSSLTAMTISGMSSGNAAPEGVSARLTPTGGATAGAVISWASVFSEETNAGTYLAGLNEMVRRGMQDNACLRIAPGSGMSVVQGGVASVGNIGFDVVFQLEQR